MLGKNIRVLTLSFVLLLLSVSFSQAQHKIGLRIHGLADTSVIWGYYRGEDKYIQDSVHLDSRGRGEIRGDSLLPQGMYLVLLPDTSYFDLMLGEDQIFDVETHADSLLLGQRIKGAKVSEDFLAYSRFMHQMQTESRGVYRLDSLARAKSPENPSLASEYKAARDLGAELDRKVKEYQQSILKKHGDNVLGKFCRATIPVEIPKFEPPAGVKNVDSARWVWSYRYNTQHYLDHLDLSDPSSLRNPVVVPKVYFFLDKMILQLPDTISKYCDRIISMAESNEETYSFFVSKLLNRYQISEIVGMDAVVVHIAEKYYLSGRTPWMDEESLDKIREYVALLKPNLLGQVAPDFTVETLTGETFQLSKSKKYPVTVILFWEPTCSHCKKLIPKLDSVLRIYGSQGMQVIGFMTQGDGPMWQKYVTDNKLTGWTHVWDPYRKSAFHKNYNITTTPNLYILDEERKIIVKRIGVESVGPIVEDMLKRRK